jgi:hypothetical protein
MHAIIPITNHQYAELPAGYELTTPLFSTAAVVLTIS